MDISNCYALLLLLFSIAELFGHDCQQKKNNCVMPYRILFALFC